MNMLLLFLLLSGSIFLTAQFNKKMDVTLPVWAFIIITILYIFSLVHVVDIGMYVVIITGTASAAAGIILLIRQKRHAVELLTPGLMVFIILFFISWWSSRNLLFTRWDEYSHWGLIIKNIKMLNGLSGHPDAFVTFKDYPPAVSLFESLFVFFSKGFREGSVYHGMHMLYFMMALPLFQHIQWKHYFKLILTTVLVLMMPTVFIKDFYTIVYVDAILGVMFAYVLLIYFFTKQDIFRAINLGLAFFVLVLTKPAGIGLAIIALMIIAADILTQKVKRKEPWRQRTNDLKALGLSIAGIAVAKISWVIYLNVTVGARQGSEAIASFGVRRELMTHIDVGRLNVIFENFSKYITRFREFASIDLSFILIFHRKTRGV